MTHSLQQIKKDTTIFLDHFQIGFFNYCPSIELVKSFLMENGYISAAY